MLGLGFESIYASFSESILAYYRLDKIEGGSRSRKVDSPTHRRSIFLPFVRSNPIKRGKTRVSRVFEFRVSGLGAWDCIITRPLFGEATSDSHMRRET